MHSKRFAHGASPAIFVRAFSLCLATLVAGLFVPALAGAEWTTPVDLSKAGQDADFPEVAVDADGDAVFTWLRYDGAHFRVQARARSAAGTFSPVQTLSGSGQDASDPQVAVDAAGNAVFAWVRPDGANDRVQTRARSAAGALSAVQAVSDPVWDADVPQVAVRRNNGDAVFTWTLFNGADNRVQTRARSAAGARSAVQNLSPGGQNAFDPQVAVDADGDAVFTWFRNDGANFRVQARARSAAGARSAVQNLSSSGRNAVAPDVAVAAAGDAVFTWIRNDGANFRAQARARSAAAVLSNVQNLSAPGQNANLPQVAVRRGTGDAVFTWTRFDGANTRVQARARSAAGALSAVQDVSDPGQDATVPQVSVDAQGDAVFAWLRWDETSLACCYRAQTRSRSAAGALRPFTVLSDPGSSAFPVRVGVDNDGDATVAWVRPDGNSYRVQASAGP
jgi:hypothetical protein